MVKDSLTYFVKSNARVNIPEGLVLEIFVVILYLQNYSRTNLSLSLVQELSKLTYSSEHQNPTYYYKNNFCQPLCTQH